VRRRDHERGDRGRERQPRQHVREDAHVVGDPHERPGRRVDSVLDDDDVAGRLDLRGQVGPHRLDSRRGDRADVGERQRDRVLIALEHRAMDVEHRAVEQTAERGAADDPGDRRRDDRARREEVGLLGEDHAIGHAIADQRAHAAVVQRRGRAVGELLGVEQRSPRIARQGGRGEQERRQHHQDGGHDPAGVGRHCASECTTTARTA
jgi:hypothetical protein